MIIGRTLGLYIAARFTRTILGMLLSIFGLIFTLDFVELMRRAGDSPLASTPLMLQLAAYRTPAFIEQVLPFAVLFGAMMALLGLSRKLELVIARSAGVSAWQFLTPAVIVALLIGALSVAAFNPVASRMKQQAAVTEAEIFQRMGRPVTQRDLWLRQTSTDGQAIIRATSAENDGRTLLGVTIFNFDPEGRFLERIEARSARLGEGAWTLVDARIIAPDREPASFERYALASNLDLDQVKQTFTPPDQVSFWDLGSTIDRTERAGLDASKYRLHQAQLTARPMLLVAMVLVAASVSLRFFRFGGVARMVLGGVVAGFVLYVATELLGDLGQNGLIMPATAAWFPAILGGLLGVLALLHLEDG